MTTKLAFQTSPNPEAISSSNSKTSSWSIQTFAPKSPTRTWNIWIIHVRKLCLLLHSTPKSPTRIWNIRNIRIILDNHTLLAYLALVSSAPPLSFPPSLPFANRIAITLAVSSIRFFLSRPLLCTSLPPRPTISTSSFLPSCFSSSRSLPTVFFLHSPWFLQLFPHS